MLELTGKGARIVTISSSNSVAAVAVYVGDPGVAQMQPADGVQFWIGESSIGTAPVNPPATWALWRMLAADRDGLYAASDAARSEAREALSHGDSIRVIQGPCLVTGVDEDGGPASLDESFLSWVFELLGMLGPRSDD